MKTQQQQNLVSILLPTFNVGHFLPQCLDSILAQSHENLEIIAIDDFSRDDTWKILKIYKKFDKRIKIYRNVKHYGKAVSLNRCLTRAKGAYLTVMDAKDIMYKDRLKKQLKFLEEKEKAVAVGVECTYIDSKNKRTGKSEFPSEYDAIYHKPLHGVSMNFETVLIKRALLPKDLIKFNVDAHPFMYSDIIIKLLQFGTICNLPDFLHYHRTENPNKTTSLKQIPNLFKLWVKSMDSYDYKPSIRSFFLSPFKPNFS